MPRRITRTSTATPSQTRTSRKKGNKRSLNAFSIANAENPERTKVRQHRLGEVEDAGGQRKRRKLHEDDEDNGGENEGSYSNRHVRSAPKDRFDELDISEGEDSEGNTWRMGHVGKEDDSEIDSDEAFASSDEDFFEGFTFRGSSSGMKKKSKAKHTNTSSMNLDEDDVDGVSTGEDDDSLGEDAVDLATMLDQSDSEEETSTKTKKPKTARFTGEEDGSQTSSNEFLGVSGNESLSSDLSDASDDQADDASDSESDDDISESSSSNDQEDPKTQQLRLQKLIISMQPETTTSGTKTRQDVHESQAPSQFGLSSKTLKVEDLLPTITDRNERKALKLLRDGQSSNSKSKSTKVAVPLPKRQQDRLDRIAANSKAKETLDRWVDTVKHNRRAEHLSFPLKDPNKGALPGTHRFNSASQGLPMNDLEDTIQGILKESGLASSDGKTEEEKLQKFEELETKHVPLEEILARRAELRRERELLFREERKAKRIKKIKSKAYRRVHRKERERAEQRERDALVAAGVEMSDDEREQAERRRAEERMGAKHRESKWAKGVKKAGRGAWDDEARAGVTEMARRNEELRKRIAGHDIRAEEASDETSDDPNDDDSSNDSEDDSQHMRAKLDRVKTQPSSNSESKLASMAFMKRSEAARKAQNDEDIARLERELAGQMSEDESDDEHDSSRGRQIFGPSRNISKESKVQSRHEFEEPVDSDKEWQSTAQDDDVQIIFDDNSNPTARTKKPTKKTAPVLKPSAEHSETIDNPWLTGGKMKNSKAKSGDDSSKSSVAITIPSEANKSIGVKSKAKGMTGNKASADADGWTVVTHQKDDQDNSGNDSEDEEDLMPFVLRNQELVQKAFAGDDVVADFEKEKEELAAEEDDKIIDTSLPGWGNWTGPGISKREKKRNKGQNMIKEKGIKPSQRKDAKLDKVIINEKRVKKNAKYMASQLPHPFENRQQYERSLRLPVGPEWTTSETFQSATKPRVMVKQGIITPMSKPLV